MGGFVSISACRNPIAVIGFLCACVCSVPALAEDEDTISIKTVSVRLFLASTGELSPNILHRPYFGVRNFTVFSEDDLDGQYANAFIVDLEFSSKAAAFVKGEVAKVELLEQSTGKVLRSDAIGSVYVPRSGITHIAIHYPDQMCQASAVHVTAREFDEKYSLPFSCGE